MNKNLTIVSILLMLLSFNLSFSALDSSLDTTQPSTSSSSGSEENKSGYYSKETQVIGSKYEFYHRQFKSMDFDGWLDLFALSKAAETYVYLIDNGSITRQGMVITGRIELDNSYFASRGDIIKIKDIAKFYRSQFRGNDLISILQSAEIIDKQGYLVGSEQFSNRFNEDEFLFVKNNLNNTEFDIQNKKAEDLLASDLYNFLLNKSTVLVVKKLETTNYQSKKSGFLDSLVDSMAGNFVGKLFNPDKIKTSRSEVGWAPQFNPFGFYDIYFAFNNYPYQNANRGLVGIFGNKNLNTAQLGYKKYNGITQYNADISMKTILRKSRSNAAAYGVLGLKYDSFRDTSSKIDFYNLYIGAGGITPIMLIEFGVGLVYRNSTVNDSLGLSWKLASDWYIFNPTHLYFSYNGYTQPNFLSDKNKWDYYELNAGIGANFANFAVRYGYQWNKIQDAWVGSVKLFF